MPKIHDYAVGDAKRVDLPPDFAWKVRAYKTLFFRLGEADALLLEKLVSELEDEAASVTIAGPPLDLSDLITDVDRLQSIGSVAPIISESEPVEQVTTGQFPPTSNTDDEYDPFSS